MTAIEFIVKHHIRQIPMAEALGMSEMSFRNKVKGGGKSKPFTREELDFLFDTVARIGDDIHEVKKAMASALRAEVEAKEGKLAGLTI